MKHTINSWMAFIEAVKTLTNISLDNNDYRDMLQMYISGKKPEDFIKQKYS